MNFEPLSDNLLVEPLEDDNPKGGFAVSQQEEKRVKKGKVLAVGPGRTDTTREVKTSVQVGDIVIYPIYIETPFFLENQLLAVVPEKEVLGILRPKK